MKKRYSQKEIISMISQKTGYLEYNITEIFVAFEEIVNDLLLTTNSDKNIEIRVIPGLVIYSSFIPKHDKRMPDGSIETIRDSIRFSAKFTDNFTKSRRKVYEHTLDLWERVTRRKRK